MAQLAPLIGKNLGVKKVPITYRIEGKKRFAEIPNILHMSVDPLPTKHPSGEIWANTGHAVSPDKLAFAVGAPGNTFTDHGMRWDNSGKNGHYAPIRWLIIRDVGSCRFWAEADVPQTWSKDRV
jgi:hypothetical protein